MFSVCSCIKRFQVVPLMLYISFYESGGYTCSGFSVSSFFLAPVPAPEKTTLAVASIYFKFIQNLPSSCCLPFGPLTAYRCLWKCTARERNQAIQAVSSILVISGQHSVFLWLLRACPQFSCVGHTDSSWIIHSPDFPLPSLSSSLVSPMDFFLCLVFLLYSVTS